MSPCDKITFCWQLKKVGHRCGIVYVFGGGVVSNESVISYATCGNRARVTEATESGIFTRSCTGGTRKHGNCSCCAVIFCTVMGKLRLFVSLLDVDDNSYFSRDHGKR
ncbi:unnamed protein product [Ectocarpus sp. 12 AP-2014]